MYMEVTTRENEDGLRGDGWTLRDDIREKGLLWEEVYDHATWSYMEA